MHRRGLIAALCVMGSTTRFEHAPVRREQAAILLYAEPASELSRRLASLSVTDALRKAGYEPTLAATAQEFASAIRGRAWNLVVIDVADIRLIESGSERRTRAVLPVTYTMTGREWNQAKRLYPGIVKSPTKAHTFVDVVDAALESQRSARK